MKTYTFYHDAGHGWLKVRDSEIIDLGLSSKISQYSYKARNGNVYLEEDCDALMFLDAVKKKDPFLDIEDVYEGGYSNIRTLERY